MILNENYFDDIEITDDDIKSSNGIVTSHVNEYPNLQEWYMDIKSKYTYRVIIQLLRVKTKDKRLKQNISLIIKRIQYIFDTCGIESSEPTLQSVSDINMATYYKSCSLIDVNGLEIISDENKKDIDYLNLVFFFNIPRNQSYKDVFRFIGSIMNYIWWKNKFCGIVTIQNIQENSQVNLYNNCDSKLHNFMNINNIIEMFFPENKDAIRLKLVNNNGTEYKNILQKYFYVNEI